MRLTTKTLTLLSPEVWGASVGARFGDVSISLSISLLGKEMANVALLCYIARAKGQAPKNTLCCPAWPMELLTNHYTAFYYDKLLNMITDASTSYISCTYNVCTQKFVFVFHTFNYQPLCWYVFVLLIN